LFDADDTLDLDAMILVHMAGVTRRTGEERNWTSHGRNELDALPPQRDARETQTPPAKGERYSQLGSQPCDTHATQPTLFGLVTRRTRWDRQRKPLGTN
jgi:hypothetical protein